MSTLVLLELDNGRVRAASRAAISLAQRLQELEGLPFDLLLLVPVDGESGLPAGAYGARALLTAADPRLAHPVADRFAAALTHVARERGATTVVAASSTFSKDVLPRAAALLDAGMLTDVLTVERRDGRTVFRRPVYAGNALADCELRGGLRVLTCRATAFPVPAEADGTPERLAVDPGPLPDGTEWGSREERASERPELTEARVVVTGGRPMGDRANFERLAGGLADALGGAVGATRAAVDSGIAPNDWQVGQTGKVVAPELYVACGVSGAIQHLAGMKDSKVIVAINKDPEAPIFQVATYGLVADIHDAVPALTEAIRRLKRDAGA